MSVVFTAVAGTKRRPALWRRYRVEFYFHRWQDSEYTTGFLFLARKKALWYAQGDISARVIDTWKEK